MPVEKAKLFACAAARGLDLAFVSVLITGTVTNAVIPASLGVAVGSKMEISFLTLPSPTDRIANDGSGVHVTDGIGAYPICNETLTISFGDSSLKGSMGDALPATEFAPLSTDTFLSIVSKRPVNDGIYISPSATAAKSLPIKMAGTAELYTPAWNLDFSAVYDRGTFPSLHMKQIAEETKRSASSSSFGELSLLFEPASRERCTPPERMRRGCTGIQLQPLR